MQHTINRTNQDPAPSHAMSRGTIALIAFLAIAAFYLISEHRAHVFGYLPFLLLLACPLLHMFMHRGHGGHGGGESTERADNPDGNPPSPPAGGGHRH